MEQPNSILSKGEIDRLGNLIRKEQSPLSDKTLSTLQNYRTSHQDSLSEVFIILCSYIRKIHPASIVTYRIKRFESIIGKLNRYPEMRLSRMWDIGGCRFIVRSDEEVYKVQTLLRTDTRLTVIKEYDYIREPQKDGYKSLHLFVRCDVSEKVIEVQVRSLQDHNWATLVEITDVLYDSRIKELGNNEDLGRFHYLLSRVSDLSMIEKKEISRILRKYQYFEKLSEVFSRNYLKVRQQWYDIRSHNDHRYYLIETSKDDAPKIHAFKNSNEAEKAYLAIYKSTQNANIVLTHLPNPTYHQISIAYSNYILTFHSFLDECYEILESLIVEALEQGKYHAYFKVYALYNSLVFEYIKNLMTEVKEVQAYSDNKKGNIARNRKKEKEWISDIEKQVRKRTDRTKKMSIKFFISRPKSIVGQFAVKQITWFIGRKYKRKIKNYLPR